MLVDCVMFSRVLYQRRGPVRISLTIRIPRVYVVIDDRIIALIQVERGVLYH